MRSTGASKNIFFLTTLIASYATKEASPLENLISRKEKSLKTRPLKTELNYESVSKNHWY